MINKNSKQHISIATHFIATTNINKKYFAKFKIEYLKPTCVFIFYFSLISFLFWKPPLTVLALHCLSWTWIRISTLTSENLAGNLLLLPWNWLYSVDQTRNKKSFSFELKYYSLVLWTALTCMGHFSGMVVNFLIIFIIHISDSMKLQSDFSKWKMDFLNWSFFCS